MFAHYKPSHFVAFNFAGFACISIVVFLASSQPFYITEVIGINQDEKIGSIIGTLGFVDELASIVSAPLVGALSDKINRSSVVPMSGSKLVQATSFIVIALSLFGYSVLSTSIYPDLIAFRIVFAIGVTTCMSMVTVALNEVSSSDFTFSKFLYWKESSAPPDPKKNGKYAALFGFSTGLGAIFAVSAFLSLPVNLQKWFPDMSMKASLKSSYLLVSGYALLVFFVLFLFLYDVKKENTATQYETDGILLVESADNDHEKESYFQLLKKGIEISKDNSTVKLAYIGGFVARSTSVTTAVFIPLFVYNFYYRSGKCDANNLTKKGCHDGYVFSAILTGVAQTVSLFSAPIWGWMIDSERVGKFKTLLAAGIVGVLGNFGMCLVSNGDPHTVLCFVLVSLIGFSQIGIIITSMSLLSSVNNRAHLGSLSGLYSLSGGLGILIISKAGGIWSDHWVLGPFFLLGVFNVALIAGCVVYRDQPEPIRVD